MFSNKRSFLGKELDLPPGQRLLCVGCSLWKEKQVHKGGDVVQMNLKENRKETSLNEKNRTN